MITIFKTWGMPKWIKVDNGRPFGDPQRQLIPVLALWLMGLGIRLTWNRVRMPTDNAKVERKQGVLANWTEYEKCADTFALQCRLWKEAEFHNVHYPVARLKQKTRLEAFPDLLHSQRPFCPQHLQVEPILDFLAEGQWTREVSKMGQISFYGRRFSVGSKYRHQVVSIKLDRPANLWQVFNGAGNLIKEVPTGFTVSNLWKLDLSDMSKND